ncbi:PP2C family protein-serine/threonine phosphatase [Streptomyces sp. NPDC059999]|uniref:PP2C family protein-serine/threonine phosphatase n=1 Tax=Streptomyces sp. NPDC059999 TaxID=3347030 RepID=UPI0036CB500E
MDRRDDSLTMLTGLLAAGHLMPMDLLPAKVAEHAARVGFRHVRIYVADMQERVLRMLPLPPEAGAEPTAGADDREIRIEGTLAGRAYQHGEIVRTAADPLHAQWWVPMLNGSERLGLLRLTPDGNGPPVRRDAEALASLIALLIVTKSDQSDAYARLVRTAPMNVAAEMQWHLIPPQTYADGRVVVAATMEPAYEISGDAFDYAMAGPVVHLSVFDAMGHDTAAGLAANLAVGACRNARRQGADLVGTSERVEEMLIEQFRRSIYMTGVLAELDTRTGVLTWVNRGHLPPLLIRGGRWAGKPACPPAHPMGTDLGLPVRTCREQLEPGDCLVLYTDGITEARRPGSTEFGLANFTDFLIRHHADGLPLPETLRRLVQAVMAHHDGRLQDDATVLLCEWFGPDAEPTRTAAARTGVVRS